MPLLDVKNLHIAFDWHGKSAFEAVRGLDLQIERGECLCLVGESGSGKSVTGLSLARLLPTPPASVRADKIEIAGQNVLAATPETLRRLRGQQISYVFQEPMTSLNPVLTVGRQLTEVLEAHPEHDLARGLGRAQQRQLAADTLGQVGIPDPTFMLDRYPHQLSGGMRQRVMIAMAIMLRPALLIADEPTTALDVTIQEQILFLLDDLRVRFNMSILFITHDLGIVRWIGQKIAVIYAGQIVEVGTIDRTLSAPAHPYTEGLLNSIPEHQGAGGHFRFIAGRVPSPDAQVTGCRFRDRCPYATANCDVPPELARSADGALVRCHHPDRQRQPARWEAGATAA